MPGDRPHIILLMADQLRRDCLSCHGDLPVHTPNLDALAQESIVFDNAYCSTPLCVPTRTSLATGKWPHTSGVIVNGGSFEKEIPYRTLARDHRTFHEALHDRGYRLHHVGVQHVNSVPKLEERVPFATSVREADWLESLKARGLDPAKTIPHAFLSQWRRPTPNYHDGRVVVKHFPSPKGVARWPHPAECFQDSFWASEAERMIALTDPSQPQFMQILFWAPHPPLVVPEPYWSMYRADAIELPATVGVWCEGQPASLLLQTCGALGAGVTREEYRPTWAAYFGLVTLVDECLGRVVRSLKARGIWDDALVIFCSDHGEMLGCHALWEKHCCYEEASHIPLLIKPPRSHSAGQHRKQFTGHIDLADTICDYAGAARLPGSQGISLRRTLDDDGSAFHRSEIFIEFNGDHGRSTPSRAVVGENFKYIHNAGDVDELYDLTNDPHEQTSLVKSPEHATVRTELRDRLAGWMRESGDFLHV